MRHLIDPTDLSVAEIGQIIALAEDIAEHSDLEDLEPEADAVACIAFELARLVTTIFEAV